MKKFTIPAANNAATAARHARLFSRAQEMATPGSGYEFTVSYGLSSGELYKVTNPEGITYICDPTLIFEAKCTCPDFAKHEDVCKHLLFCNIMVEKEDAAEDAQVAYYEEIIANGYGRY